VLVEKLNGAQGLGAGRPGDAFVIAEIEKILAEFVRADLIRWFAVMDGELLDGLKIGCLRAGRQVA
jgi:hypothetical protein